MSAAANPRRSNGHRRDKLRRQVAAEGLPCHICGLPINYGLPAGDPMSYELDEIIPVSKGGSPLSRENVAPAHRICNQKRGNRDMATIRGECLSQGDLLHMPLPVSQEW